VKLLGHKSEVCGRIVSKRNTFKCFCVWVGSKVSFAVMGVLRREQAKLCVEKLLGHKSEVCGLKVSGGEVCSKVCVDGWYGCCSAEEQCLARLQLEVLQDLEVVLPDTSVFA
jgi:hypothetical protein